MSYEAVRLWSGLSDFFSGVGFLVTSMLLFLNLSFFYLYIFQVAKKQFTKIWPIWIFRFWIIRFVTGKTNFVIGELERSVVGLMMFHNIRKSIISGRGQLKAPNPKMIYCLRRRLWLDMRERSHRQCV
jgi:hypothetical protein